MGAEFDFGAIVVLFFYTGLTGNIFYGFLRVYDSNKNPWKAMGGAILLTGVALILIIAFLIVVDKPQHKIWGVERFSDWDPYVINDPLQDTPERSLRDIVNDQADDITSDKELRKKAKENIDRLLEGTPSLNILLTDEEVSKAKFKSDRELKKIYDERIAELEEQEFERLRSQRYQEAQRLISDELMKFQRETSYNLLAGDAWYKPAQGAKDLVSGTACMCPSEVRVKKGILYAPYGS